MKKKTLGALKRKTLQQKKHYGIPSSWMSAALVFIAICQLPITLKASLELACIASLHISNYSEPSFCKIK
ncbi:MULTISPECIES: hypothetical protein [Prochlorococcus]|uniref:hypothetical protein n=1 Tax=Prochlorococcus TaxID=1218 RepID=UPI00056C6D21|nr:MULTISPECIES: hypothetical protein [Prochlorococcus]